MDALLDKLNRQRAATDKVTSGGKVDKTKQNYRGRLKDIVTAGANKIWNQGKGGSGKD